MGPGCLQRASGIVYIAKPHTITPTPPRHPKSTPTETKRARKEPQPRARALEEEAVGDGGERGEGPVRY